ncbi:TorF family putative porin [Neptuniibacter halophilus]|uniref:TorF family putative porin n=1 Tax=Neptuniibacter halophilus TaxID=651666 RepID=UPI0025737DB1|nr:TorF family putative porin [Neptuniibacter halophilus]
MMKSMTKSLLAAGLLSASVMAEAGLSANIGAMSDYYFRGVDQGVSGASMMGGVDYEADNGLSVGTWAASLNNGEIEYDLYGGYSGEFSDFSYYVGYAGYFYTEDGATDFHEINFNLGYGPISFEYTVGTEDAEAGVEELDYTFAAITGEYEGAYLTYGSYGNDYDGEYWEIGYNTSYEGLDMGVAYVDPDSEIGSEETVTFYISKTFEF